MKESSPIKTILVEDNEEYRKGIAAILNIAHGIECVASFSSAEEAMKNALSHKPDVALMDIGLPGKSGIECVRYLKEKDPELKIVMLTAFEDNEKIFAALEAGANAYLLKNTASEKIVEAIREVMQGGSVMSSQIARRVIEVFHKPSTKNDEELSTREKELITLLSRGFSYREIAESLFISTETVRRHIHNIYTKLHVRNRTEALAKVYHR